MSIWVKLHPTAALLAFGVIIYINPTYELNVFCSNFLLLCQHFALCFSIPIMPKFMLEKSTLQLFFYSTLTLSLVCEALNGINAVDPCAQTAICKCD